MTAARLLVTDRNIHSGEETVELIHETLVSEWVLLRQWLQEDRLFLAWRQTLERRCRAWIRTAPESEQHRDLDLLLRGRELDEAAHWLEQRQASMSKGERAYILASLNHRDNEQHKHERQRRWAWIAVATVMMVLTMAAVTTFWQSRVVKEQLAISESRRIALAAREVLESNPELSLLLAIEAANIDQNAEVDSMLHQVLQAYPLRSIGDGHAGTVTALAFKHDNSQIVTGSTDRTARIWNVETGDLLHVLRGHSDIVNDVDFSPDGRLIVTASGDKTARI